MTKSSSHHIDPNSDIDAPLWHALMAAAEVVDLSELARVSGMSPEAVHLAIRQLESSGCQFDHQPNGVRLLEAGPGVWQDYLAWRLSPSSKAPDKNGVGYRFSYADAGEASAARTIQVYQKTGSTQDSCRRIIDARGAAADGAIVAAHHQSEGRGRLGRSWVAPPGTGVTVSIVRVTDVPAATAIERLMLASALGAAAAIEKVTSLSVSLKWPNDLLIDGLKIGGILVETQQLGPRASAAIIGVGINVSLRESDLPADEQALKNQITSITMQGDFAHGLLLLGEVVAQIEHAANAISDDQLLAGWRQRSTDLGQSIHLREGGRDVIGEVVDIDPQQGIVVRTDVGSIVHLPAATTTVVKRG